MKGKKPLVSIIIVSWNGKNWLKGCLQTIKKQTYTNIEIIIVDNGSIDGSVEWIKQFYPECVVLPLKTNVGFAEGNNKGFKESKGDLIYFLNNDTELSINAVEELVTSFYNNPQLGGVQSKLLLLEDKKRIDTIGAFLTPTGFLYHNAFGHVDKKDLDKSIPLYTLKGASMMFRREVLLKVLVNNNVFDTDYFAYFEETDLCHRIWLSGYTLYYSPKAIVWHHMGATSSKMDNNYVQFHSFKNRIMTYAKLFELSTLLWLIPCHIIVSESYAFITLIKGNLALWWTVQKAIFWNIKNCYYVFKKRIYVQRYIKKVKDKDLLPIILKHPPLKYYFLWLQGKNFSEIIT